MNSDKLNDVIDNVMDELEESQLTIAEAISVLEMIKYNLLVVAQDNSRGTLQ